MKSLNIQRKTPTILAVNIWKLEFSGNNPSFSNDYVIRFKHPYLLTNFNFSETYRILIPILSPIQGLTKMSLTKADIIQIVAEKTDLTNKRSAHTVECLLEIMKDNLASGEDVLVSGFGKFCVQNKSERRGRNPATGEEMMLRPRKVVTFKCSGKLRERCNGQCD